MPITASKKSLLSLPRFVKRTIAMFFDTLLCAFTVWLAFGLRLDQWGHFQVSGGHSYLLLDFHFRSLLFLAYTEPFLDMLAQPPLHPWRAFSSSTPDYFSVYLH